MSKVFFGTAKIQALRRVALDANLLANLNLSQNVRLVFISTLKEEKLCLNYKKNQKKHPTQSRLELFIQYP
jgi:hypothetical protein